MGKLQRIYATLTNLDTGRIARVLLKQPNIYGGIWSCSIRSEKAAYKRIGASVSSQVITDSTYKTIDLKGYCVNMRYSQKG